MMVGSIPSSSSSTTTIGNVDNGINVPANGGSTSKNEDQTTVRVALRIRPPLPRELINGCQVCTSVTPGISQVWIGGQHAFTYDYVFDTSSEQASVFEEVRGLIDGCLEGFNATIIAYGQTGSGKTYTMGTGFDMENIDTVNSFISQSQGIVPRAVHYLFECMENRKNVDSIVKPSFKVSIQFIELYNEEVIDLVDGQQTNKSKRNQAGGPPMSATQVKIHEDSTGGIYLVGVGTQFVHSAEETMKCLRLGALGRTTASTNMNDQSSRSHAIFTMHIEQTRVIVSDEDSTGAPPDFETLTAKFHFVDLAGSERLKRTGAVGDRQKEGISINCGLLALGNVISALGDKSKKASHIPYRDSKLTRLLQDSLGGNSRTIMIACVSPCDVDFVETLNTLKYANRARNIKNKVTINQDKSSRLITELRERIRELEDELLEFKQGKRAIDPITGEETETDTYIETKLLQSELNTLRTRNEALQGTVNQLTAKNTQLLTDRTLSTLSGSPSTEITELVQNYTQEIEQLSTKLIESELDNDSLKKKLVLAKATNLNQSGSPRTHVVGSRPSSALTPIMSNSGHMDANVSDLLETARREVQSEQDVLKRLKRSKNNDKSAKIKVEIKNEELTDEEDEVDDESNEDHDEEDVSTDETDENENYSQLATLSSDITTKQKLIEQLETTQRRMEIIKQNYEEKLSCLSKKISATEVERDKVLFSAQPPPKLNLIKADYERKLNEMQNELKKWQQASREHQKFIKQQSEKCKHIEQLKNELEKMKQTKVKLMNQIKAESVKFRNLQSARSKEIAQLKKEQRKKDNAIRLLTSEKNAKEGILKRKHEEINYLKNKMRTVVVSSNGKKFSPVKAKLKWAELQTNLIKSMKQKQNLESYESEMMQVIENRKQLNLDLEDRRLQLRNEFSTDEKNKIIDEMDSITKSLNYAESRLNELQGELLSNNEADHEVGFETLVQRLNKEECCYIMKKMYEYCSENLGSSKLYEKRVGLLEKENQKLIGDLGIVKDLYKHIYSKCNNNQDEFLHPETLSDYDNTNGTYSKIAEPSMTQSIDASFSHSQEERSRKARRLTQTPAELLGSSASQANATFLVPAPLMTKSTNIKAEPAFVNPNEVQFLVKRNDRRAQSFRVPRSTDSNVSSAPTSAIPKFPANRRNTYIVVDKTEDIESSANSPVEPTNGNNGIMDRTFIKTPGASDRLEPDDGMDIPETTFINSPTNSPQVSPLPTHRALPAGNTNNVFQRLTSQTTVEDSISRGVIKPVRPSTRGVIYNSHVAEGHSKAVLSICATESRLYSGGKDSTVKIWDLNARTEVQTLTGNPGNVVAVRCSTDENLVFTASWYIVKVWDRRAGCRCVKTLSSSGSIVDDIPAQIPANTVPNGEYQLQALTVTNNTLYTTFGDRVRAWDIRQFTNCGLLKGVHKAPVMCMASDELSKGKSVLVTGSKDHSIKVYEVGSNDAIPNTSVRINLEPPHYDGIQSLAMSNGTLYSGSRDRCIKKWDLNRKDGNHMEQAVTNAHMDWITGLAFAPNNEKFLLSVSRDGFMKLWSVENNMNEIDKFEVSKRGVECITSNSNFIFTGSSNGEIKIWRLSESRLNTYYYYMNTPSTKRGRLLRNRPDNDIMTMSTGRILQLSIDGKLGFWKLRSELTSSPERNHQEYLDVDD